MKRILIMLLLAIGVLGSIGGYLYYNDVAPFGWLGRRNGKISPVTIADTTKTYSIVQRTQLERPGELPMPHGDAELANWAAHYDDKTYVPPSVSYVRLNIWLLLLKSRTPRFSLLNGLFLQTRLCWKT